MKNSLDKPNSKLKNLINLSHKLLPIIVIAIFLYFSVSFIGSENISQYIQQAGVFAPIVYILLHAITIIVAPLGGEFLFISSGVLFGFWQGIIYSVIAGLIGGISNFWIARHFGIKLTKKLAGDTGYAEIQLFTRKLGNQKLIIWLPFMLTGAYDLLCYVAGFTHMKFTRFLILITVSSVIGVPLYVAIGSGLINFDWSPIIKTIR